MHDDEMTPDEGRERTKQTLLSMLATGVLVRGEDGRLMFSDEAMPMVSELIDGSAPEQLVLSDAQNYQAAAHALHFMIDNRNMILWWAMAHSIDADQVAMVLLLAAHRTFTDLADIATLDEMPTADDPHDPHDKPGTDE